LFDTAFYNLGNRFSVKELGSNWVAKRDMQGFFCTLPTDEQNDLFVIMIYDRFSLDSILATFIF
jgi:hypothetical protein